ncbi:MAG: hypothetical protein QF546_09710 [Alphaproteobacteria bacterium]|nr:hypothetical protein [Alphaproteobacteria bacterium]HJP22624.1 hypothetical protein [Alphaproteobacteria bacterium]
MRASPAESHGGRSTIESELGVGTTVNVALPRERLEALEPGCRAASQRPGSIL